MSKILLVDDDNQLRSAMVEMLESESYDVWDVCSIKEAIQTLNSEVSLLICDIVLQDENGIEFIDKVKEHYPDVKVIAISGGIAGTHSDHYLKSAKLFGADAVLKKPFKFHELIDLVKEFHK